MTGYVANIEDLTKDNNNFRQVLFTGKRMQLVVMSLLPGEEIGLEVHPETDQFFRVEEGKVKVIMNGEENILEEEMVAIVPAGTSHNVINVGEEVVKIYTIYTPPEHADGTIHATKAEAELAEADHHN